MLPPVELLNSNNAFVLFESVKPPKVGVAAVWIFCGPFSVMPPALCVTVTLLVVPEIVFHSPALAPEFIPQSWFAVPTASGEVAGFASIAQVEPVVW